MDAPSPAHCPRCGAFLDRGSVDGLCAKCLAALNFATDSAFSGEAAAAVSPPTPEEIAVHFPQLEVIGFLGRGGMGVVYKARQKALGRLVALKLLAPERSGDPKFAERFAHEAKALAALNHPSIVTIHDFGQAGGFFYLVMEFVDGVNLRQAMKAGRFTPEQALAIVPPVCEALQYAHEHGIVHRDIKPENLLLDREGRVKIADFGIAKILGAEPSGIGLAESQPAGTPQYMAPEQKEHRATDHRADIYSLGVVLYEMLTGELPATKLQPPSRRVQVDVRIDEIVLRALEKTPELRYQTAVEFRTQVQSVAAENGKSEASGRSAAPVAREEVSGPPRISRLAVAGACWVPLAIIVGMLGYLLLGVSQGNPAVPSWGRAPLIPMLIIAATAPFGTTILGWLAVIEIRRSRGRVYGLQLALFEGLVFPLIALSAVIAMAPVALAKMFVDFYANPAAIGHPHQHMSLLTRSANWLSLNKEVAVFAGVAAAIVVSVLIVRAVMRAVRREVVTPESRAAGNQIRLASIALIVAALGLVIWLPLAAVVRRSSTGEGANVPEIEKVEVANDRATISQRRYDSEGMIITFGPAGERWTPPGVYLEAMFDTTLEPHLIGSGATWVMKPQHGLHFGYRLDGPPGPMLGRIVFHPGTPVREADGSYVIGEFRPENGRPLPIAVKVQRTSKAGEAEKRAQVP